MTTNLSGTDLSPRLSQIYIVHFYLVIRWRGLQYMVNRHTFHITTREA